MAWTIKTNAVQTAEDHRRVIEWYGIADASDLTDTVIVDLSALTYDGVNAPSKCRVLDCEISCAPGVLAYLEFDRTTDQFIMGGVPGCTVRRNKFGHIDDIREMYDDDSTGNTGDIVITTLSGAVGDAVRVLLHVELIA